MSLCHCPKSKKGPRKVSPFTLALMLGGMLSPTGGEGEIRTLERFYPLHDFQSCALLYKWGAKRAKNNICAMLQHDQVRMGVKISC